MGSVVAKPLDQRSGHDRRDPENEGVSKIGVEVVKAIIIALAVYFATNAAHRPAETQISLQDHDKRLAVLESKMTDIKLDLQDIKQAVGARRR